MEPITVGLIFFIIGLVGGGTKGFINGRDDERAARTARAQLAHSQTTVDALQRRLTAANTPAGDNRPRSLTNEELADPTLFLLDAATDESETTRLRDQVSLAIAETLAQQAPSQNELNRCLLWAVRFGASPGFIAHIEALLARGAQINYAEQGHRPISIAIYFCVPEVVRLLLTQNGIDLQARIKGKTVLQYARSRAKYLGEATPILSGLTGPDFMAALHLYQAASRDIFMIIDRVVNPAPAA